MIFLQNSLSSAFRFILEGRGFLFWYGFQRLQAVVIIELVLVSKLKLLWCLLRIFLFLLVAITTTSLFSHYNRQTSLFSRYNRQTMIPKRHGVHMYTM